MEHQLIDASKVQSREYQVKIAENVLRNGNSLVILPTGMGKTIVALLVIQQKLINGKKVLFIAPTRPLAEQHHKSMTSLLRIPPEKVLLLTGTTVAEKRGGIWQDASIICATPQTIENDLGKGRFSLDGFGLCVVDECHRAVKKYAYTAIAGECREKGVQMLGLTASPGGKRDKIEEVMRALDVKHIEIRTESDGDVVEYVKKVDMKWVNVEPTEKMREMCSLLEGAISDSLAKMKKMGIINTTSPRVPKKVLLEVGRRLQKRPDHITKFLALSQYATVMNLTHMHELIETQGISAFLSYVGKLEAKDEKSKAVLRILGDARVKRAVELAKSHEGEHPKLAKLLEILRGMGGKKVIVFVQFRDQVRRIVSELLSCGLRAKQFVGKRDGVTLAEQKGTIQKFRDGEFDIMVASSIGEEGLDIPSVDAVIFYEPIPSEIRSIQRRGRAGRAKAGEVVVLVTKGTRDEAYYWVSKNKEAKMKHIVRGMQKGMGSKVDKARPAKAGQAKMSDYL